MTNLNPLQFPKINLDTLPYIRGVIIDVDDTLYDYAAAHSTALSACTKSFSNQYDIFREQLSDLEKIVIEVEKQKEAKDPNLKGKKKNQIPEELTPFGRVYRYHRDIITQRFESLAISRSRMFAFQEMFEKLGMLSAYDIAQTYDDLYWETLTRASSPTPGSIEFLTACKQRNLPVCALTNMTTERQVEKLRHLGMVDLIPFMVTSEEVGIEKGFKGTAHGFDVDEPMYQAALRKLGNLTPQQAIMIGDSMKNDIEPARALGMEAFQVVR